MNTTREQREKLRRHYADAENRGRMTSGLEMRVMEALPALLDDIEEAEREVERIRRKSEKLEQAYEEGVDKGEEVEAEFLSAACEMVRVLNDGGGYARNKLDK